MNSAPYWYKQTPSVPLHPNMIWSRPENRAFAGKLLIVGGQAQSFVVVAEAYAAAQRAGAGSTRVLLPNVLQKNVSRLFPEAEYAPSTPSGSFAQTALGELLPMAHWADGVLLAGDLGRNSETAILLEKFMIKHTGQLTLTKDTIEYVTLQPHLITGRSDTLLVVSYSQLQKLGTALRFTSAFTFDIDVLRLVDALHEFTIRYQLHIITKHLDMLFVAVGGEVSSTPCPVDEKVWRVRVAAGASVWWLQNPSQMFAAVTTSLVA